MLWKFRRPFASDDMIDLIPIDLYPPEDELGFGDCYDFIITLHRKKQQIGRISLRFGESEGVFYFGHIGYHIDPPWRGNHFALRACRLIKPVIETVGKGSVVITCDPGNQASQKTIEALGAVFESEVRVPKDMQERWDLSAEKRRYIWRVDPC